MGSRRTHEKSAVAAARAAYIAGFSTTSNLCAGQRYGIPTTGTCAHAFTLLHDNERDAFEAQVATLGAGTTLLVDTYDVAEAVRTAIEVAGTDLGAVRLDSGDLLTQARDVRAQLDALGATKTRIVVTSDLDEHAIAALAAAPVDSYGVGTSLVTGSGAPTAGLVYKLVARAASDDADRTAHLGRQEVAGQGQRRWTEVCAAPAEPPRCRAGRGHRHRARGARRRRRPSTPEQLVSNGEAVGAEPLAAARDRHGFSLNELPGRPSSCRGATR